MKIILLTLFIFMISEMSFGQVPPLETGVSRNLAQWRSANYSDIRYKLNITLEKGAPLMKGTIEISVKLTDEGAKNDLVLDWRTTQFQNDKDKPFATVVSVNDSAIKKMPDIGKFVYFIDKEHIVVTQRLLKTGENIIKINFASPIKTSGSAITRYIDKEDGAEYIYSLFVPSDASTAFPVFDQPDLKARFHLSVTKPKTWKSKAISNAKAVSDDYVNNWVTTDFEETRPISSYVFAFAVGEFAEFVQLESGKAIYFDEVVAKTFKGREFFIGDEIQERIGKILSGSIYVRKSQAEKFKQHADKVFRLNREGVKFLESYFDYKFPFPKYDLVLIPEFPFGGMEHAGATFLRESSVIFPTEPTKNDYVSRANVIFHEAAHQWFGDTVTMKWFDDLWLKEGFAEFMAYKTLEKVMPEYNAWKIFYERNKQLAYLTDSTKGTTPIYQEIKNLSAAKSAYGNIVYRKAPSFLKQAEFFWGAENFQKAVRNFLKNHEFANATWQDLVKEIEEVEIAEVKDGKHYQTLSDGDKTELEKFERWSVNTEWADFWVNKRGTAIYKISPKAFDDDRELKWFLNAATLGGHTIFYENFSQNEILKGENYNWLQDVKVLKVYDNGEREEETAKIGSRKYASLPDEEAKPREEFKFEFEETEESRKKYEEEEAKRKTKKPLYVFPNYKDYGYGIFLLDEKSRAYILENIQNEKDDFLRAMMWGSLWDSVREAELAPKEYVELVIKNINVESDESTIQTLLGRTGTAMNYYLNDTQRTELAPQVEKLLIEKFQTASTVGQKITYFRALQSIGSGDETRKIFKDLLNETSKMKDVSLKTKDKFDLVTRLLILDDKDAPQILAKLEKTETSDEAKRYAYAARAAIRTAENKAKFFNEFVGNKEISESWIEAAFVPFNSIRHSELTLPFLEKALAELPNLKKNRKIFFVNGWLAAFINGQKSEEALKIVNEFLEKNPNLDRDLRLKILENVDGLERAVKIRAKYGK